MSKKLYFDNEAITNAILEYQKKLSQGINDTKLLAPYTQQIQQLVRGIINTHKIYRWWNDIDELIQEGMVAVYSAIQRYDPERGTAFNYLSITVKNHLKNWTQSKNRKNWQINEYNDEIYRTEEVSIDDHRHLEDLLYSIEVPSEYEELLVEIINTIVKYKISHKRDIVSYLVKQGQPKKDIEELFKILEKHFNGIEEDE